MPDHLPENERKDALYKKKFSASLIQMETGVTYLAPVRMGYMIERLKITKVGEGMKKRIQYWLGCKLVEPLWAIAWRVLQTLKENYFTIQKCC